MTTPLFRLLCATAIISLIGVIGGLTTVIGWPHLAVTVPAMAASVLTSTYLARLALVLRHRITRLRSARLLLIAPLLPSKQATEWLPEMDNHLVEFEAAGRPSVLLDVVLGLPMLILATWRAAFAARLTSIRVRMTRLTLRLLEPRFTAVVLTLQAPNRAWPTTKRHTMAMVHQWRQLRWWSWCLRAVVDRRRYPELAETAGWLLMLTRKLLQEQHSVSLPAHHRVPTPHELAFLLALNGRMVDLMAQLGRITDEPYKRRHQE